MKRFAGALLTAVAFASALAARAADLQNLSFDLQAAMEAVPLVVEGAKVFAAAQARLAKHDAELAAKGIAEEPASRAACRYRIDTGGIGDFVFDQWGELYIDRRFLTESEMATVRKIEAFVRKHLLEPLWQAGVAPGPGGRRPAGGAGPAKRPPPRRGDSRTRLSVFRGFEDARYQQHDALIARMTAEFNANKAAWCGGSAAQAAKIRDITPDLVKSHMIEESGGNGPSSKAAWAVDPLQVNVPGDWGKEKELVGLSKPERRNEGTVENNVRAAIMYLSRKGFGSSARPAADRPSGFFDGWPVALTRYNGRRDRTATDRYYSEEYSDKIVRRAANPDAFVPIEIKLAGRK